MGEYPLAERRVTKFGRTIAEMAQASGVSRAQLREIERGRVKPWPRTVHRLAEAYQLSPSRFMAMVREAGKDYAPTLPKVQRERLRNDLRRIIEAAPGPVALTGLRRGLGRPVRSKDLRDALDDLALDGAIRVVLVKLKRKTVTGWEKTTGPS